MSKLEKASVELTTMVIDGFVLAVFVIAFLFWAGIITGDV